MKRATYLMIALVGLVAAGSTAAVACNFSFSYERIEAPLGAVGEIGIRVEKTHTRCVLSSMDLYEIVLEGGQIIGETEWVEVDPNVFEKWVEVSLSEQGEGRLVISKFCTKEGYEEGVLPITVTSPIGESPWEAAMRGDYPFEAPADFTVASVLGSPLRDGEELRVGDTAVLLPDGVGEADRLPAEVRLFTAASGGDLFPLLLVGDGLFLRFDHLASV